MQVFLFFLKSNSLVLEFIHASFHRVTNATAMVQCSFYCFIPSILIVWNSSKGKLISSPKVIQLFYHLFVAILICGYLFYFLDYNAIIIYYFISLIKVFQIWPLEKISDCILCHLDVPHLFLHFFFCPNHRVSHFSREHCCIVLETILLQNQTSITDAHCFSVSIASKTFQWIEVEIYVCTIPSIHTYLQF